MNVYMAQAQNCRLHLLDIYGVNLTSIGKDSMYELIPPEYSA